MFLTKNSSSKELNASDKKIVGVSTCSWSGFPSISYEDDFSGTKTVTNRKVEFAYPSDTNLSDTEEGYNGRFK